MACGSVAQSEGAINLASLAVNRCDPVQPPAISASEKEGSPHNRRAKSIYRGEDVHEAILFLQREHEKVLSGLHQQVEHLQQRCDDLQFEAHLSHIITKEEDLLRKKIDGLKTTVKEKSEELGACKQQLQDQTKLLEEERDQHRWKEIKLQQQIEVSNQRTSELKAEVARLKGQVHDLKVFSSALRTSNNPSTTPPSVTPRQWSDLKPPLTPTRTHKTSEESLDSLGPRSLGSEEGDWGMWREARLGGGGGKYPHHQRGARPLSSQSSHPGSLPPLSSASYATRPSSSTSSIIPLPPIQTKVTNRPHVRRQLRLLSAPNLEMSTKPPAKIPP